MPDPLIVYREMMVELVQGRISDEMGADETLYMLVNEYAKLVGYTVQLSHEEHFRQVNLEKQRTFKVDRILDRSSPQPTAAHGGRWATYAWGALLALAMDMGDASAKAIEQLIAWQQPGGAFLLATPSDNVETLALHELQILHAVETYSLRVNDPLAARAAERAALWHLQETQPDHATHQPWGLNAFVRYADTRPMADMMLSSLRMYALSGLDGTSLLLLHDCLYCTHRYQRFEPDKDL